MKISLGLPTHRTDRPAEFLTAAAIGEMALVAERAGFDAVFVTDHPFPGDVWLAHGGHHTLDPFVALALAGAATTTVRLQTNLLIAAYRNPFLVAKSVASLDVATGGRVILGLGAGYLEPEFAALGVDFDERNDLTDEAIVAMRAAWTGESVSLAGRHFAAPGNTMLPVPATRPAPPIWIGGNSKRAIRRAVELADGWIPMPNPARSAARRRTPPLETIGQLAERIAYAREAATAAGRRAPLEVVFTPLGLDMFGGAGFDGAAVIADIAALEEVGVTYLTVMLPAESRSAFVAEATRFGVEVIERMEPKT